MKTNLGLLILRVAASLMMMTHGWQKIQNYDAISGAFPDPIGLGSSVALCLVIFAEFFCSILIILGIGTRLAAIPPLITMLVAAFVAHAADGFGKQELPLLYATVYVTLILVGGGAWGIGQKLNNRFLKTA